MGWTFFNAGGRTAAELLTLEFSQPATRADGTPQTRWTVADQAMRGRVWYAVIKTENPDGFVRFHGLVCLWTIKGGEFGFKEMSEDMGPYESRAPLRIIETLDRLAPNPGGYAAQWRARCRAHAATKNQNRTRAAALKPGMRVRFGHGREFELIQPAGPRRGWFVRLAGAPAHCSTYRATASQIARAEIL